MDLKAATVLAGAKGFMITLLKNGTEYAENRLERGRYANSFQVQEMDCHGAEVIDGQEMIGLWK